MCSLDCAAVDRRGDCGLELSILFDGDRTSFSAVDGSDAIATLSNALEALEHSEGVGDRNEPAGELVRDPCTDDRIELTVAGLELALLGDLTSVLSWDSSSIV